MYLDIGSEEIEFEVHLEKHCETVYDLTYILVDLQAFISGFNHLKDSYMGYFLDEIPDEWNSKKTKLHDKEIDLSKRLIETIKEEIPQLDDRNLTKISDSIQTKISDYLYNENEEKVASKKERLINTSTRTFTKKYKDLLILNSFKSGSILLTIISPVLSGLILKFLDKIIFAKSYNKNNNIINVNIKNSIIKIGNNIQINDGSELKKIIKIDSGLNSENYQLNINEYIDNILNKVKIDSTSTTKSVYNLLNVLAEENIISKNALYNERGVRTVARDADRLMGSLIDLSI